MASVITIAVDGLVRFHADCAFLFLDVIDAMPTSNDASGLFHPLGRVETMRLGQNDTPAAKEAPRLAQCPD